MIGRLHRYLIRRGLLCAAILLFGLHGSLSALAADADAIKLVQRTTEQLRSRFIAERTAIASNAGHAASIVDSVIGPHIDFPRVGRMVLGKYWRRANGAQRERFLDAFRGLLLRTYANAYASYTGAAIRYVPPRPARKPYLATVRTRVRVRPDAPEVSVDYKLHNKEGGWKVYSVVIEGVDLVTTYRNSLAAEVKKRGIDGVIDRLSTQKRESTLAGAVATPG